MSLKKKIVILISPFLFMIGLRFVSTLSCSFMPISQTWIPFFIIYYLFCCTLFPMMVERRYSFSIFSKFGFRRIGRRSLKWVFFGLCFSAFSLIHIFLKFDVRLQLIDIILVIGFILINPFFEEFYWRGFLFGKFQNRGYLAAIYSSIVFGIHHLVVRGQICKSFSPLAIFLTTVVSGLVWCLLYKKTDSLIPGYLSHIIVNIPGALILLNLITF
ncbi:MAG: type II CAAX endopeptidase family protein [bacterium]